MVRKATKMGLIENIKLYFIKKELKKSMDNPVVKKVVGWFFGSESKKRYIVALWLGYKAVATSLGWPVPHFIEQIFPAFAVWAGADALKKLQPTK